MPKGYKIKEEFNVFYCETCAEHPEMTPEEAIEHVKIVHGISEMKGTRSMIVHLDGKDFYCSKYAWDIGGVNLTQECQNRRSPESAAYWG
jgi:hypothetical protein